MSNTIDDPKAPFVPNYLLYLLAAASEAASARFHSHVRTRGLRVPEWRVMACLTDTDGSMVTELARYAMIEQSRLTKIIIQMDARGLVTRRSDPTDGRRVRVFLTPQGRALASGAGRRRQSPRTGIAQIIPGRRRLRNQGDPAGAHPAPRG
jgi:DNA-binding MarR family transcriptional regulator